MMKTRTVLMWPFPQQLDRNIREPTIKGKGDAFQMARTSGLEWMYGFPMKLQRDNDLAGTLWKLWVYSIFDFDKNFA